MLVAVWYKPQNVPPPFPGCPLLAGLCHPSGQGHPGAAQGGEACLQRGVLQGMERGGRDGAGESQGDGESAGATKVNKKKKYLC